MADHKKDDPARRDGVTSRPTTRRPSAFMWDWIADVLNARGWKKPVLIFKV
jgi:hypothetical protein